jgi:DNA-binding response OmpR family regulator
MKGRGIFPSSLLRALTSDEKYVMQGFMEGAVDYLFKPLNINILKAKVKVFERLFRQQKELKDYMQRLEALNKQLDEFVYIVSHDLKAPLRGIASLGSFIEEELGNKMTDS